MSARPGVSARGGADVNAAGSSPPATPAGAAPTVAWRASEDDGCGALELLDQTRLPHESVVLRLTDVASVRAAIGRLSVRGAPAIGVAGAYGLVVAAQTGPAAPAEFREHLTSAADRLRTARPTAVNLAWAVDRCLDSVAEMDEPTQIRTRLLAEARTIHAEDEAACAAMGRHGATLLRDGASYLTHCNTGRLATAGIGTALGVLITGHDAGLELEVFVGEVRPLLQGSRLTAFELQERDMRGRLLPDSAAAPLLRSGRIEGVFVGADRIARNGDAANKIGTYGLAELAHAHGVPFYVVAPTSTLDPSLDNGDLILIEERAADEVLAFGQARAGPVGFPVWNPAFDVTPAHLITAIITERGIARPPFESALAQQFLGA